MSEVSNNHTLPWRVMVERVGLDEAGRSLSKGEKFYSSAATEEDAEAIAAAARSLPEDQKNPTAGYTYSVRRASKEELTIARQREALRNIR